MTITCKRIIVFCLPLMLAVPAASSADEEAAIKYRQNLMKANSAHIGSIVAIVKGQVPHTDHLVAHAEALNSTAMMVGPAFSQRTEGGETRAKADIWKMSAEFDEKVKALRDATAVLLSAAKSGGADAVGPKIGAVGDSCKGCHEKFREKKS